MADALFSEYHWSERYVLDCLPLCRVFMYYRAIQARYDVDGRHPRFEDDERSGPGFADFRRQIRAALAAFKRGRKQKSVTTKCRDERTQKAQAG